MQIKSYFKILIGLSVMFSCRCLSSVGRQMPLPDLSALKDDSGTLPLSDDYLPAVMQALHYYTEMMQYEQLPAQNDPVYKPPATTTRWPATTRRTTTTTTWRPTTTTTTWRPTTTTTTWRPTTTTTRRTTTTTTRRPTTTTNWRTTTKRPTTTTTTTTRRTTPWTTTRRTTPWQQDPYVTQINLFINHPSTPRPHKPGNFAPEKPPYYFFLGVPNKPEQGGYPSSGADRPQQGINIISEPDWKDPSFIQWFFQPKPKEVARFNEIELQQLDPLPKKLLFDLERDDLRTPALLDFDNVQEFRKRYDDYFFPYYRNNIPNMQQMRMKMKIQMLQNRQTLTGRKKAPPTRPYVTMVMLYDLLKREAKSKKLQQFGGFTPELLTDLHYSSLQTGDYQIKYLLEKMLERQEVTPADVVSRTKVIISDLEKPTSDTFKTLRMIPPLSFVP